MIIFGRFTYNYIFSSYLSSGSALERLVLKNAAECTSQRLKRTSGVRVVNLSLSEYICVVFLNLARGRETIKLPAVKTELLCIVFTLGLGPKLVKLNLCVVFFELVWGQPRSVLTAALYHLDRI